MCKSTYQNTRGGLNMLIVLEGCDGSGKTTLANKLAAILDAEIIHCTTDTPNTLWFFRDIIEMAQTRNIIADRFCYGQFVYQNPEERALNEIDLYNLELEMMNTGAKVIYVYCDEDILKRRLDERGEIPMKPVEKILTLYSSVFSKSLLPIKIAETSEPTTHYMKFPKDGEYR